MAALPRQVERIIQNNEEKLKEIGKVYRYAQHCLFLGYVLRVCMCICVCVYLYGCTHVCV